MMLSPFSYAARLAHSVIVVNTINIDPLDTSALFAPPYPRLRLNHFHVNKLHTVNKSKCSMDEAQLLFSLAGAMFSICFSRISSLLVSRCLTRPRVASRCLDFQLEVGVATQRGELMH